MNKQHQVTFCGNIERFISKIYTIWLDLLYQNCFSSCENDRCFLHCLLWSVEIFLFTSLWVVKFTIFWNQSSNVFFYHDGTFLFVNTAAYFFLLHARKIISTWELINYVNIHDNNVNMQYDLFHVSLNKLHARMTMLYVEIFNSQISISLLVSGL